MFHLMENQPNFRHDPELNRALKIFLEYLHGYFYTVFINQPIVVAKDAAGFRKLRSMPPFSFSRRPPTLTYARDHGKLMQPGGKQPVRQHRLFMWID